MILEHDNECVCFTSQNQSKNRLFCTFSCSNNQIKDDICTCIGSKKDDNGKEDTCKKEFHINKDAIKSYSPTNGIDYITECLSHSPSSPDKIYCYTNHSHDENHINDVSHININCREVPIQYDIQPVKANLPVSFLVNKSTQPADAFSPTPKFEKGTGTIQTIGKSSKNLDNSLDSLDGLLKLVFPFCFMFALLVIMGACLYFGLKKRWQKPSERNSVNLKSDLQAEIATASSKLEIVCPKRRKLIHHFHSD